MTEAIQKVLGAEMRVQGGPRGARRDLGGVGAGVADGECVDRGLEAQRGGLPILLEAQAAARLGPARVAGFDVDADGEACHVDPGPGGLCIGVDTLDEATPRRGRREHQSDTRAVGGHGADGASWGDVRAPRQLGAAGIFHVGGDHGEV